MIIGDNWWKLVSALIPQHIYIFGIVLSSWSTLSQNIGEIGIQKLVIIVEIGENWWELASSSIPQHLYILVSSCQPDQYKAIKLANQY